MIATRSARPRNHVAVAAVALAVGVGASLVSVALSAGPRDRTLVAARLGLRVEAPPGWELSRHAGYPFIAALLLHPDGARISVSADDTSDPTVAELVARHRRALGAVGISTEAPTIMPRGFLSLTAVAPTGEFIRQAYAERVEGPHRRQAIVVTLVTRPQDVAAHTPSFEFVVRRLAFLPWPTDKSPNEPAPSAPDAGVDRAN